MEATAFLIKTLSDIRAAALKIVKAPIEGLIGKIGVLLLEAFEIWVKQRLCRCQALVWVPLQQILTECQAIWLCTWVKVFECIAFALWTDLP